MESGYIVSTHERPGAIQIKTGMIFWFQKAIKLEISSELETQSKI